MGKHICNESGDVVWVSKAGFLVPLADDPDFPGGDVKEPRNEGGETAVLQVLISVLGQCTRADRELTKIRANGRPISSRYSPNFALRPSSPSVSPMVGAPNSEGKNSFTPACFAASPKRCCCGSASCDMVETTTSMLCSLKAAASADTSVRATDTTLISEGRFFADVDSARATTVTLAPSARRAWIEIRVSALLS